MSDQTAPKHTFFYRLYTGTGAFNIVGRRRFYYRLVAAIMLVAVGSIVLRGFSLGIDFEGGTRVEMPAGGNTTSAVEEVFAESLGFDPVTVQIVGAGATASIQIRSEKLDTEQAEALQLALFEQFQPQDRDGTPSISAISSSDVSETWGGQITKQALIALVVFLIIIAIYITIRFEWDMAIAALGALVFDLAVTSGVYSLVGFEVTPATVIGLLTILGFSLYDTVVVFDKVEENTRGFLETNRRTYAEQANLAVNQTIMRSINTTIIGVIPIVSLMVVAVWMLGVGTLKDLALVQMVGVMVGTFSSIFFATPLLVTLKERRKNVAAHTAAVLEKREARLSGVQPAVAGATRPAPKTSSAAPAPSATGSSAAVGLSKEAPTSGVGAEKGRGGTPPRPGARPTGKRRRG
jgi:preprotein translocase subunit SecF